MIRYPISNYFLVDKMCRFCKFTVNKILNYSNRLGLFDTPAYTSSIVSGKVFSNFGVDALQINILIEVLNIMIPAPLVSRLKMKLEVSDVPNYLPCTFILK